MLKKRINFKRVERKLTTDRVNALRKEAGNIEAGIISRTQGGRDVKGSSFKSYSSDYIKKRSKTGRGSSVNLTYTGAMLQAISHKSITNGLRFYFNASAEMKKAFYNQKTRKFFGTDKKQIKYLKGKLGRLK